MTEIDELGNRLLELKKQTENQKKIIDEFKTEREHLFKEIQSLDKILQGIVSTYGKKGDKLLYTVQAQIDSLKDELKKRVEETNFNISQFSHRIDSFESKLTSLDSDTDRLASERITMLTELKTLEKLKDDLSELQKWKDRAFERIDNQDGKIDDRMRELGNLEKRIENSLRILGGNFEKVIKNQREDLDVEFEKLRSQMKELVDIQQSHIEKVEEDIRDLNSTELTPRILKIDNALKEMKKLNIIFQTQREKTEKLYQATATFKSNFKNTEENLKKKVQESIKKMDEFEMRMTSFMNELVQEYEKRFDMVRRDIEKVVSPLEISESLATKGEFQSEGFLNKVKKIFIKEDKEKEQRITMLEDELKRQKMLMKKLLVELKSVTDVDSK